MNLDNRCIDCAAPLAFTNWGKKPERRPLRCHKCAGVEMQLRRHMGVKYSDLSTATKLALKEATKDGRVKYPDDPWPDIPEENHLEHAALHLIAYIKGDRSEDHRGHALWRIAAAIVVSENYDGSKAPGAYTESLEVVVSSVPNGLLGIESDSDK